MPPFLWTPVEKNRSPDSEQNTQFCRQSYVWLPATSIVRIWLCPERIHTFKLQLLKKALPKILFKNKVLDENVNVNLKACYSLSQCLYNFSITLVPSLSLFSFNLSFFLHIFISLVSLFYLFPLIDY